MTLSGNDLPVSVDTEEIETLLQAVNDKLMFIDEKMEILILPDEEETETETVSDNSAAMYESVQMLEKRQDILIKQMVILTGFVLIALGVVIGLMIMKWIPKR